MHQFYAKSRADKAALRRKYERFRELTPILAYKGHKQKDLDEVRLLEWRLLTQVSDLQGKQEEAQTTLAEYENLPLLRRLTMQAVGEGCGLAPSVPRPVRDSNRRVDERTRHCQGSHRRTMVPEAAVPKDMRPEFEDLKEEIVRLGGDQKDP
jgi:hypothetical protein